MFNYYCKSMMIAMRLNISPSYQSPLEHSYHWPSAKVFEELALIDRSLGKRVHNINHSHIELLIENEFTTFELNDEVRQFFYEVDSWLMYVRTVLAIFYIEYWKKNSKTNLLIDLRSACPRLLMPNGILSNPYVITVSEDCVKVDVPACLLNPDEMFSNWFLRKSRFKAIIGYFSSNTCIAENFT